jgi:hypothetical protein
MDRPPNRPVFLVHLAFRNLLVPAGLLLGSACGGGSETGPDDSGPGPAAYVTLEAGSDQTAPVGSSVLVAPAVCVTDAEDRPVAGVGVSFAVASGGGAASQGSAITNANGVAAVGSWRLGPSAGPNTLMATWLAPAFMATPSRSPPQASAGHRLEGGRGICPEPSAGWGHPWHDEAPRTG